jgi:prophage antirepressor-like protein
MSQIIPFEFESHALRNNLDAAGQPWFNVIDVCQVLELGNPSQALKTHVDSDGGAPTATVITDGTSNAIFPDISELDRAGGRVNLRKLHVSVQTMDTDTYILLRMA